MLSFSQKDFDSTAWINAALDEHRVGYSMEDDAAASAGTLEAYLAALNLKVHVAAQEKNEQLEVLMQDIAASTPRIVSEGIIYIS